jgi:G3E family GTPase
MRMDGLPHASWRCALKHLPETVFRAKGFVYATEKSQRRLVFQLVGRRATVTVSRPWGDETPRTRLVFIARHGTVNIAAVDKALNGCKAFELREKLANGGF